MKNYDVIIIGAGMTGLSAAITLQKMGLSILVLDKGRGYGGRMATRRIGSNFFDHGTQYLQPSPRFHSWLEEFAGENSLADWNFSSSKKVYVSPDGMNQLAKKITNHIPHELNKKVTTIKHTNAMWNLTCDDNTQYSCKKLLVTAPLPQALELLRNNNLHIEDTELNSINYRSCLVLMLNLKTIHNLPEAGAMFIKNPILEWVCDNQSKGLPNSSKSVTIHCTEEFSKDKYDLSDEKIFEIIYSEFEKYFPNELESHEVKKWKYSTPLKFYSSLYFRSQFPGLYLAGDSFGGNSLDGAFRSGTACAYVMKDDVLV